MTAVEWTDERVAQLSRLWQEGYYARQIAEHLNNSFPPREGEEVTRNAVIGKANRLGLSKPSKSSITRAKRQVEKVAKILNIQPPVDCGANIFSLTATTCRWPIGDPGDFDFHFCGADCSRRMPYCDYHYAMSIDWTKARNSKSNRKRAA